MGQVSHYAGQVIFTCHLPRDKFCQKYLSDPVLQINNLIVWQSRMWNYYKPLEWAEDTVLCLQYCLVL